MLAEDLRKPAIEPHRALSLLRDATRGDDVAAREIEEIAAALDKAHAMASFQASHQSGDPFHSVAFPGGVPQMPKGPMFASFAEGQRLARLGDEKTAGLLVRLMKALDDLQRALIYRADCQEYGDALNNERQYLCAAGYLDLAEPHVLALVRHLISGRAL